MEDFSFSAFIFSFTYFRGFSVCGREEKGVGNAAIRQQVKASDHQEEGALGFEWDNGECSGGYLSPLPS